MSSVTLATEFQPDTISFGKEKINKRGGRNIPIEINGDGFLIQTPVKMRMPFDVQIDENDNGQKKYSLNIALGGSTEAELFKDKLEVLDTIIRQKVSSISTDLWGSHKSEEVCEELRQYIIDIVSRSL